MSRSWLRALSIGLVMLVLDAAEPLTAHRDYSGSHPTSYGLTRLARDLTERR